MSQDREKLKAQMAERKAVRQKKKRRKKMASQRHTKKLRAKAQRNYMKRENAKKKAAEATKTPEDIKREAEEKERQLAEREDLRARQELARRELARRHLLSFQTYMRPEMLVGWFNRDLCYHLEGFRQDVIDQKEPRLMLFVPPRHGKSMTCSIDFPAQTLGQYPNLEFINTSYSEALQLEFSKSVQSIIRSTQYGLLFPNLIIPKGNEAASNWKVAELGDNGRPGPTIGGMLATGVGGPISGRGAHIATVDDPLKNREEADSIIIRKAVQNWYSSTFYTRLAPGGGILIIQTRWHDDDLSGWLLTEMAKAAVEAENTGEWPEDADRWQVISYPGIATQDEKYRRKGEPLHAERYNLTALLKRKRTMAPRDWSALYQQNPVAEEGDYFKKSYLVEYAASERPPLWELDIYCAGDLAISTKETADWTVFVVAGLDRNDNIWILDIRRGRWSTGGYDKETRQAHGIIGEILDIYKTWRPIDIGLEKDKVQLAIKDPLDRAIRDAKVRELMYSELDPKGRDKRVRARPMQGRMSQKSVLLPAGHPELEQWKNEHLRFDAGVNDDCVDAGAWLGQMLRGVTWMGGRGRKEGDKTKSWKDRLKDYIGGKADGDAYMGG